MSIWFLLAAFIADVLGTMAGFGSSTLLLPIAVLFFDFGTALALVAWMHIAGNIGRIVFFRQGLSVHFVLIFGAFSVVFSLLGALLVTSLDQATLKGLLGVFLTAYAGYSILHPEFKLPRSRSALAVGGASSGFLAGLIGTGGALRSAALAALRLPKAKYIATSAAVALAVDATRLPIYIHEGFLPRDYIGYLPVLFVLAIAGSYIGKRLVDKIPQLAFTRFVLSAIGLAGLYFVVDWLI